MRWNNATRIHRQDLIPTPEGAKVDQIQGPLFLALPEGFQPKLLSKWDGRPVAA